MTIFAKTLSVLPNYLQVISLQSAGVY